MAKIDDSVKKKVPELRFKGFTDEWEERKLGDLANIVGGGTPSTSNPEYWDGDIDWYAPAEIGEQSYVSKSKKTITELGLKKSSARILPVGTVLFTSRAGIGNTAILGKEATTNQGFQSIVPDQNKLDSYFIYSRTNELKRYGEVTGTGSTFVEVSGKQMSKMPIMIPELSEQQKIGSFFKQLDDTIALHQRKLDLLKEQKKGFLQKMFPKNGAKVPELRFAGFADDWEERKLNENVENIGTGRSSFKAGLDYSEQTPYEVLGSTSVISYSDSFDHSGNFVLTARVGANAGNLYKHSGNVKISDNTVYIQSKNLEFIFYLLTKYDLKKLAFGTGQPLIKASELKNLKLFFPKTFGEQQKIGSFFQQLDETIALHQRKLDLLKEQKKGFLQKMFV